MVQYPFEYIYKLTASHIELARKKVQRVCLLINRRHGIINNIAVNLCGIV